MAERVVPTTTFYVYILFRHDTGTPFYVGKGFGRRWNRHAELSKRDLNRHKKAIIHAAISAGADIPKIKVAEGLTERAAHALEVVLIASIGRACLGLGPLTNMTDGGEGKSGNKHSPESLAKMSSAQKGKVRKPMTAQGRANISASKKGRTIPRAQVEAMMRANLGRKATPEETERRSAAHKGKVIPQETRKKISDTLTGRKLPPEQVAKMIGRKVTFSPEFLVDLTERTVARNRLGQSDKTRAKLSAIHTGMKAPPETCVKISEALSRRPPISDETRGKLSAWQIGKPRSEEDKQKMRDGWARRKLLLAKV